MKGAHPLIRCACSIQRGTHSDRCGSYPGAGHGPVSHSCDAALLAPSSRRNARSLKYSSCVVGRLLTSAAKLACRMCSSWHVSSSSALTPAHPRPSSHRLWYHHASTLKSLARNWWAFPGMAPVWCVMGVMGVALSSSNHRHAPDALQLVRCKGPSLVVGAVHLHSGVLASTRASR
jgi:hypothetical protein